MTNIPILFIWEFSLPIGGKLSINNVDLKLESTDQNNIPFITLSVSLRSKYTCSVLQL